MLSSAFEACSTASAASASCLRCLYTAPSSPILIELRPPAPLTSSFRERKRSRTSAHWRRSVSSANAEDSEFARTSTSSSLPASRVYSPVTRS